MPNGKVTWGWVGVMARSDVRLGDVNGRSDTGSTVWWRRRAIREDLERALTTLNASGNDALAARSSSGGLAASLGILVSAVRSTELAGKGMTETVPGMLEAERALRTAADGAPRRSTDLVSSLEYALDMLLGSPSRKLAIYGSLAPGEANHHVIADITGTWRDGFVRGHVAHVGWGADYGFPALTWDPAGPKVNAKLFVAELLPGHWQRLDRFEGDGYRRILVPVEDAGGVIAVANVYAESVA